MSACDAASSWLVLQHLPGMTPQRLARLVEAFGGPAEALGAPLAEFARIAGGKARQALEHESPADMAARLRGELESRGIAVLIRGDESYPAPLDDIYAPPGALFVEGALRAEDLLAVAVVGMRTPSDYGRRMAREIAGGLAAHGVTVVSGLAPGVDTAAHRAALDAGGRTVAVLGCGLGVDYPPENHELREQIARQGAVISEFPWSTPPRPYHFPQRNRIISGLALATVVVEAAQRSGALLTARLALEQGKEVMALPGPVHTGRSAGCHRLIREGAHLVESVEDILATLPGYLARPQATKPAPARTAEPAPSDAPLSEEETALLELLRQGENTVEGITRARGLRPEVVAALLLQLELQGRIRQVEGGLYAHA